MTKDSTDGMCRYVQTFDKPSEGSLDSNLKIRYLPLRDPKIIKNPRPAHQIP